MNIVHIHPGPDTGGQSMAGKRVLEAAGHTVRVFAVTPHRFGYETPELWSDPAVVSAVVERADTVVVHNDARVLAHIGGLRGKRLILHHHGSHFRRSPDIVYERGEKVGARHVVSTIDLLLSVPAGGSADWFPQVVDVERMRRVREEFRTDNERPLVVHAPTNRQIKGTKHVERAALRLRGEVDFDIVRGQPWDECLQRKARADVFVDQLNLGYGNNAIEAWAMGLPVISGATEEILFAMWKRFAIPFVITDKDGLADDIRRLAFDDNEGWLWAEAGRQHVARFHAPDAWLANAEAVYGAGAEEVAA